jgi:hypothetical protein
MLLICVVQEGEANVKILKAVEGWRTEPTLDLSGFFGESFFGFVKADVETEAAGRARVFGEDLGDKW